MSAIDLESKVRARLPWRFRQRDNGRSGGGQSLDKTALDLGLGLLLLPLLGVAALALLILNPIFNPGPLLFRQTRMGQGGRSFQAMKFRSMRPVGPVSRGAFDRLEADRIGRFGQLLRRTRIDELPQILNVLAGEMSFVGPRPDYYDHAVVYLTTVPLYGRRLTVRPGISGFAQIRVGYVDGEEGVRRKVAADVMYLRHASLGFDLRILCQTLWTVALCRGR